MRKRVCFVVLALLVCVPLALADAPRTGLVSGMVTDPEGQVLPGARVHLTGERGTVSTVTDNSGEFRFVFVIPDSYTVRAELGGYQPAEGKIVVSAGGRSHVELKLAQVAGEEIVVVAETPMISRYDVTAGGSVSTDEINLVPAESRNIQATVAFLPGVSVNAQSQSYYGHQPQVEGEWGGRTAYYVDGVDTTFARLSGATRLFVPSFTMEQVKLESTGADAQYSRVVGGVVNQSLRSGTNQFHGGVTWYARNMDWDENYELTPVAMPDDRKDSWELSLGGPVVKENL